MPPLLRYGTGHSVHLEVSDEALVAHCGVPSAAVVNDVKNALSEALNNPLEYPPLGRVVTPGDRIVLALDPDLPQMSEIVAGVVECLVQSGVDPDGLSILRSAPEAGIDEEDPFRLLSAELRERIELVVHDSEHRDGLAYLAASATGEPILVARALHEADLVLPIGCLQSATAAGYYGIHSGWFPRFSDAAACRRFRSPSSLDSQKGLKKQLAKELHEVAWLLGLTFTIQVVPGPGDGILHVLAGEIGAVERRGRELYDQAWQCTLPRQAQLVVAAMEGAATRQNWRHLGRALEAAASLVEEGGAIAVCSELAGAPGPAVQRLVGAPSRKSAMREIRKDRPEDTLPAAQLVRALDRENVYLLSRLEPSLVEDLEMTPVANDAELIRLARRCRSCIVLSGAPHVCATLAPYE